MPLNTGDRVGSYEVSAKIGEGGMGEVYRVIAAGLLLLLWTAAGAQGGQDDWAAADRTTERLAPAEVRGLPAGIRSYLEGMGCTIPVPAWGDGRTNERRSR